MVIWGIGVMMIYAFMAGAEVESGGSSGGTTSQIVAAGVLIVWSLVCVAFGLGSKHGKR